MITVNDVIHHIAQELPHYNGSDNPEELQEFVLGCVVGVHLSITTDVEATELHYLENYGRGRTHYFRLDSYQHGKELASDLYYIFQSKHPDLDGHTGELFAPGDRLYLFVHVVDVDLSRQNHSLQA